MYLNCHTAFSFKYGVMTVEELLEEARSRGLRSLALTDINNTSACLDFIRLAPAYGIRPVVGIDLRQGVRMNYIGIARNNQGFRELNRHLSQCLHASMVMERRAPAFVNSFVIYPFNTVPAEELLGHEYIGVRPSEIARLRFSPLRRFPHKLVALCPVTFRHKKDFNAHRLLRAIDNNTLLSKLPVSEQAPPGEVMLSADQLLEAYNEAPFLAENAQRLIENCSIGFEYGKSKNKKTFTGSDAGDRELIRKHCFEGLHYRYGRASDEISARLEHELEVIADLGFSSYFLINWDIVNYARHKGFFYIGRGSGANSLAAYCLRITDVDPVELDLYFERFINPYRENPPDFDIDFSWKDRNEVIAYIFERYGREHTALLATYSTFQYNSVLRELGKVFGLPAGEIDELSDGRPRRTPDHIVKLIERYSRHIRDLPSHLSIHAGGILISEEPMHSYTALSLPPKGYPLTQFSMIEAEDIGLYKFDILSQRGLGHIKDTIAIVKQNTGEEIDIHNLPAFKEDEKIKRHLREGRTMGCFYVESPAMRMLLKKLEADTYLALVAASSIIRPGVAKSGMMREYILRFRDPGRIRNTPPVLAELLKETYGIMVYQEDVIKVAHYFAGLSLAQADVMRRGMSGKFRSRDEFQKAREAFFSNCAGKGYPREVTAEVWRQIESFAGYSFSKGHSASYAVESYQSLYLKAHFPREFMTGVINNFGGFYRTECYVQEARMAGAVVEAPCVNTSSRETVIRKDTIFLGFVHMADLETRSVDLLLAERERGGPFTGLADLIARVPVSVEQLRLLIRIGAFRFTGKCKKELLWEVHAVMGARKRSKPVAELFPVGRKEFRLPPLRSDPVDDAFDEIEILGFPLCSPFDLLRDPPPDEVKASDLHSFKGQEVSLTGYYVTHKVTSTVKGENMSFGTFLDSQGCFLDTTHFPAVLQRFPFRGRSCYRLKGKVVEEFGFPSIDVTSMEMIPYKDRYINK